MSTDVRDSLAKEQFVLLTSFKKSGEGVATPVWIAPVGSNQLGVRTSDSTWKIKRINRNPRVLLQPCTRAGQPKNGAAITEATAEVFSAADRVAEVHRVIDDKYGLQAKLITTVQSVAAKVRRSKAGESNDVVLVITVSSPTLETPA